MDPNTIWQHFDPILTLGKFSFLMPTYSCALLKKSRCIISDLLKSLRVSSIERIYEWVAECYLYEFLHKAISIISVDFLDYRKFSFDKIKTIFEFLITKDY